MSLARCRKAPLHLDGQAWAGPIYPRQIDELNRLVDGVHVNGSTLGTIGRRMDGFVETMSCQETTDGYIWFWMMRFRRGGGELIVAFPWAQDWDRRDGVQLDRSVAVYSLGLVASRAIDDLVEALLAHFRRLSPPAAVPAGSTGADRSMI